MKRRDLLTLVGITAVFLAIGATLILTKSLPEEQAKNFNALSGNMSLQSEVKILKEPTPGDNTFIYAINDAAEEAYNIARQDPAVRQIIDGAKGRAVTIAAVQPTLLVGPDGQLIHSAGGQVIITSNWQVVDGKIYSDAAGFDSLSGKQGKSYQQIWDVLVDLDRQAVTGISKEPQRVMTETLRDNRVYSGMNMFMPDAVAISAGTTLKWTNESNIPHNVVGIYNSTAGQKAVDSGFFEANEGWQYTFSEKGAFEYRCTIHSEEGMKGTIIVE
jgi:plastocyanin